MRKKHKPILFDVKKEEAEISKGKVKSKKLSIMLYNLFMGLTTGTAKIITITILSVVGSLLLTVLFTALMQERSAVEVFNEILNKAVKLI